MIAKVHRFKSGRVRIAMFDDTLEKTIGKDFESLAEVRKLMQYISPEWELLQEVRIYRPKEGE